jgi:transcription elongation factor Elf1
MAKVEKRTYRDRAEYLIRAVAKRRRKVKEMAVAYKGGKCIICGYNKYRGALDLHHLNAKTKSFGFGAKGYTRSWNAIKQEADKCVLVCANCHREVEAGITQLPAEMLVEKRGELREA